MCSVFINWREQFGAVHVSMGDSHDSNARTVCVEKHTDWVFFHTELTQSDQANFDLIRLCFFHRLREELEWVAQVMSSQPHQMATVCSGQGKSDHLNSFFAALNASTVANLPVKSFQGLVSFVKIIAGILSSFLSHQAFCTACTRFCTVEFIVACRWNVSPSFLKFNSS